MPILLRRVRSRAVWTTAPVTEEAREGAMAEFRRGPHDDDGISVYEADDAASELLVVAAIACARGNDNVIDLLEIDRTIAETFGEVKKTPGTTPVLRANELHRSLDWDPPQL